MYAVHICHSLYSLIFCLSFSLLFPGIQNISQKSFFLEAYRDGEEGEGLGGVRGGRGGGEGEGKSKYKQDRNRGSHTLWKTLFEFFFKQRFIGIETEAKLQAIL